VSYLLIFSLEKKVRPMEVKWHFPQPQNSGTRAREKTLWDKVYDNLLATSFLAPSRYVAERRWPKNICWMVEEWQSNIISYIPLKSVGIWFYDVKNIALRKTKGKGLTLLYIPGTQSLGFIRKCHSVFETAPLVLLWVWPSRLQLQLFWCV
jgi:hypothetical protein